MSKKPLRGVVLCSGSASSFRFLYENDPNYGSNYQIVGVFSDVPGVKGIEYAGARNINTLEFDFRGWCTRNSVKRNDLVARTTYFCEVLNFIASWNPHFLILSGFMLRITDPLLSSFQGRILNVHPALLSICDESGARKYTGLNTVARAMEAGDATGSTVHIVTDEPDTGPIVAESNALPYVTGDDPDTHQERMKIMCDGPAFQAALEKLILNGWPRVPWQV